MNVVKHLAIRVLSALFPVQNKVLLVHGVQPGIAIKFLIVEGTGAEIRNDVLVESYPTMTARAIAISRAMN